MFRLGDGVRQVDGLVVADLLDRTGHEPVGELAVDLSTGVVQRLVTPRLSIVVTQFSGRMPDDTLFTG